VTHPMFETIDPGEMSAETELFHLRKMEGIIRRQLAEATGGSAPRLEDALDSVQDEIRRIEEEAAIAEAQVEEVIDTPSYFDYDFEGEADRESDRYERNVLGL
jgi:hypothetical protein